MNDRAQPSAARLDARFVRDERGAAATELLVTFPVVLLFFLGTYMVAYLFTADLIVERAASAAARAASVYMADSQYFFPSSADRTAYVEEAARRVVFASPALDPDSVKVSLNGDAKSGSTMTASVDAHFNCGMFIVGFLCGADRQVVLNARASMPYQGR